MSKCIKNCSLLLCLAVAAISVEPNYVKTTVFDVDGMGNNIVTTEYSDGLGRPIQSKIKLDNTKDLTNSVFYDRIGRKTIETKFYIDTSFNGRFFPGEVDRILEASYEKDFPADKEYAYSEIEYYEDPIGRIRKSSIPGAQYHIDSDHISQLWYFGVSREDLSLTTELENGNITFEDGFVSDITEGIVEGVQKDTSDVLDELYKYLISNKPFTNPQYKLVVKRGLGRNITQELIDALGRTVATWADSSSADNDEIIAYYNYDIMGNLLEEIAPDNLISNSVYKYNTLGQLIRKETPDGSIEKMKYDERGNLVIKEWVFDDPDTGETLKEKIAYVYDDFSRLTEIWLLALASSSGGGIKNLENYYDDIEALSKNAVKFGIPYYILPELQNLKGRKVASISNLDNTYFVVDLYSYDKEGNLDKKYKILPGVPIQKITFQYDKHGKITEETIECGTQIIVKKYVYDDKGRLSEIVHANNGDKQLAKYNYNDFGLLDSKKLIDKHNIEYSYTINDQIKNIISTGTNGFNEDIIYNPDMNINSANFTYNKGADSKVIDNSYFYDNLNRLTQVSAFDKNSDPFPEYNANYSYDKIGRFNSKKEGSRELDDYTYYQNSNRLKYAESSGELIYDYRGRLVIDKRKKMVIVYDWRDLPVIFRFYSSIPDGIEYDEKGNVIVDGSYYSNYQKYIKSISKDNPDCQLLSTVVMLYDAGGNRVLKMEGIK